MHLEKKLFFVFYCPADSLPTKMISDVKTYKRILIKEVIHQFHYVQNVSVRGSYHLKPIKHNEVSMKLNSKTISEHVTYIFFFAVLSIRFIKNNG